MKRSTYVVMAGLSAGTIALWSGLKKQAQNRAAIDNQMLAAQNLVGAQGKSDTRSIGIANPGEDSPSKDLTPLDKATNSLQIAREQLAHVREHFTGQDRSSRMLNIAVNAMISISIEEALELLAELPAGTVYEAGSAALGTKFAELDPAEGVQWLSSLPETSEGISATMAFYNAYAKTDPRAAIASLQELNLIRQAEGLRAAVGTIANNDISVLRSLMTESGFNEMCQRHSIRPQTSVLNSMMNSKDYQGAAILAAGEDHQPKDLSRVVGNWGRHNPEAAASWLVQASPRLQDDQLNSAERLVLAWAEMDAGESSAWLRDLSPGLLKDHGAKGLAAAVASKDGRAAAEWVDTIASEELRKSAAEDVYSRWATYDKKTADEWIAIHRKIGTSDSAQRPKD